MAYECIWWFSEYTEEIARWNITIYSSLGGVFEELTRIVKRNGVIYVGEIYPPCGNVSWLADEDFSEYGLEKRAHKGYDEVRSFMEKMGGRRTLVDYLKEDDDYLPFFLELSKK